MYRTRIVHQISAVVTSCLILRSPEKKKNPMGKFEINKKKMKKRRCVKRKL